MSISKPIPKPDRSARIRANLSRIGFGRLRLVKGEVGALEKRFLCQVGSLCLRPIELEQAMLIDVEQIRLDPGAVKGPWVLEKVLDRRVPGIELGHRALCVDGTWTRGLVRLGWD